MVFKFNNNFSQNLNDLVRGIGYKPIGHSDRGELNCVRPLNRDYPRFHLYISTTPEFLTFSIHLDQKRPSYEGATAHSGDYDSEVVKEEVAIIRDEILGKT